MRAGAVFKQERKKDALKKASRGLGGAVPKSREEVPSGNRRQGIWGGFSSPLDVEKKAGGSSKLYFFQNSGLQRTWS